MTPQKLTWLAFGLSISTSVLGRREQSRRGTEVGSGSDALRAWPGWRKVRMQLAFFSKTSGSEERMLQPSDSAASPHDRARSAVESSAKQSRNKSKAIQRQNKAMQRQVQMCFLA